MQNKIKSILFTTLLLSTSISTLTAMDQRGASSAAHQQAQQQAQLPPISYDDLMAFILPDLFSFLFKGNEIETQRQFMTVELQGQLVKFSQRMNNIGDTIKAIIKDAFIISPFDGLVRLKSGQNYNGHKAGDTGEWVQLYKLHFNKAKAIAAANASAEARRATDPSASSQEELLQALPDINGSMALYFPDTVEGFSPEARAAEQLRLTGPDATLLLPWKGKQDNWLTHPFEHELGLNTFTDFLKTFFGPNGNAFPELQAENKKVFTDGSEVLLKLGDSVGDGIPKDLVAKLRGSTAFQNTYDVQSLFQNPGYRMPGDNPEIKWDEAKKQYYVEIPGFGIRRYAERAGQVIGWPAFRQYISVDVVKASPLFTMLMKARELAKQVMSPSMNSVLNRGITDENRDVLRETLTAFLKNIKSLNLAELEKTYGSYDIFKWLRQKQDDIATRLDALGPVRAQPQAQQPRQAPQAGPAPQPQPQQSSSYAMPDIENNYPGKTVVEDDTAFWKVRPGLVTKEYRKHKYQNAQVLTVGMIDTTSKNLLSITLPEKTEVIKVGHYFFEKEDKIIGSLFGSVDPDSVVNNPNLKVLDIEFLPMHKLGDVDVPWIVDTLNGWKQYFKNRTTPFIIYHRGSPRSPINTDHQVIYFDPSTKTFSSMSVQTYMTQYRNKVYVTPPQAGPSQEQPRAERERAEQARRAQEQARAERERAEQARRAQEQARAEQERAEQARRAQEQARAERERAEQARRAQEQARANASAASSQPSQSNAQDQVWSQLGRYLSDYNLQLTVNKISGGKRLSLSYSMFNQDAFTNGSLKPEVWNLIAQLPLKELSIYKDVQLPEVGPKYYNQDGYPHPAIFEVPSSILQMETLEKLTIDRNDGVIFPDISGLPNLKELKIGGDGQAETRIYLLKRNVDIFMARAQRNNNLYFLTERGPIHGMKIEGLKNLNDFYGINSFIQKYGHNTFGIYQITG